MTDLFHAFFNATADAIVVVDANTHTIVHANAQAHIDTEYRRAELDGAAVDCLFPLQALSALAPGDDGVGPPRASHDRLRLLTKGGDAIAVDARVTPVRLNERHYLVIVARKVTAALAGACVDRQRPASTACEDHIGIIGHSDRIRGVRRLIDSVARSDTTVLVQGESGTGKEIVANAIHALSRRRRAPFVKVNCAALTETLLESELFGHVKGAFTGAMRDRSGRFKQADRGTILLDEIGSMSLSGQAALLRVLQEHEFEPVGSSTTTSVDVRVIASTNADLAKAVTDGSFRADLYYRLNVFGLVVPSLRERVEDIPLLSRHFLHSVNETLEKPLADLAPETLDALAEHEWPGNVRELKNAIEHAAIVETGDVIDPASLPATIRVSRGERASLSRSELGLRARLNLAERQILLETLMRANGIKKRAAAMLGIDSRNMPYFLRKHRLQDAARP
jgi:transcriptional regulator with PAS, ATPase and Fis domain